MKNKSNSINYIGVFNRAELNNNNKKKSILESDFSYPSVKLKQNKS